MSQDPESQPSSSSWLAVSLAWSGVGIPLLWGVLQTLRKAIILFR